MGESETELLALVDIWNLWKSMLVRFDDINPMNTFDFRTIPCLPIT